MFVCGIKLEINTEILVIKINISLIFKNKKNVCM